MFLAGFWGHKNGEFWGEDGAQIAEEVSKFLHAKVSLSSSLQPWVLWVNGLLTFIFIT